MLPKPRLVGLDPSAPATATPVPLSGIERVGLDASDVIVTLPIAVPAVCGAKVTVNVVLFEALSVNGVVRPLN